MWQTVKLVEPGGHFHFQSRFTKPVKDKWPSERTGEGGREPSGGELNKIFIYLCIYFFHAYRNYARQAKGAAKAQSPAKKVNR